MGYQRKCCVPNCVNNSKSCSDRLYTFPKDKELFETWLKLINRPDILPKHQSLICGLHFDNDEKHSLQCKLLNQDKINIKCKCQITKGCTPSKNLPEISRIKIEKLERKKRKSNRKIVQELLETSSSLEPVPTSIEQSFQQAEQPLPMSEKVVCEANPYSYGDEEMQIFPETECFVKDEEIHPEVCYLQNLCRLCAQSIVNLVPVFGEEGNNQKLQHKIHTCLPIRISEGDGLPQNVCVHCISRLESSFELATSCQDAEKYLRGLLEQQDFIQGSCDSSRGEREHLSNSYKMSTSGYNHQKTEVIYIKKEVNEFYSPVMNVQHVTSTQGAQIHVTPGQETSVQCNSCLATFKSKETLNEQYCIFDSEAKVCCPLCNIELQTKESLKTHIRNAHFFFTCKSRKGCCKYFSSLEEANEHYKKEHRYSRPSGMCELCGKTFRRLYQLNKHVKYVHGNPVNQHKCHLCPKTYRYKQKLNAHLRLHSNDEMIQRKCPYCDIKYPKPRDLNRHILANHKEKLFQCECGKNFVSKPHLYLHFKSMHLYSFDYNCIICHTPFKYIKEVCNHYSTHSMDDKLSHCEKQYYVTSDFCCKICLKYFRVQDKLYTHIRRIHEINKSEYLSLDEDGILKFRNVLSIAETNS